MPEIFIGLRNYVADWSLVEGPPISRSKPAGNDPGGVRLREQPIVFHVPETRLVDILRKPQKETDQWPQRSENCVHTQPMAGRKTRLWDCKQNVVSSS